MSSAAGANNPTDALIERPGALHPKKIDLSLGRLQRLLDRLGNPEKRLPPTIHVAGTNGKGSTVAFLRAMLEAAGKGVHVYTSPSLVRFHERIRLAQSGGSVIVDDVRLFEALSAAETMNGGDPITFFEITTAAGFLLFAQEPADILLLETGLGGRLDATNVVERPLASVITPISMDHTDHLGDTLAKIAFEKAGIIKPGKPVVLAPQREEARVVVERVAEERHAPLVRVGQDYLFAPWTHSLDGQTLMVWRAEEQALVDQFVESGGQIPWEPLRLRIPLLGYHQVQNAATAYAALQVAREAGLPVSDAAIREGFAGVVWPGRFEVLQRSPMLVIDSAHNRDSALKLRLTLDDYLPGKGVILLFGASEDKDIEGMFAELLPRVRRVIATQSVHPRALSAEQLVTLAHQFGCPAQVVAPVEEALKTALQLAAQDESVVVAAGSLFIAAAVRSAWLEQQAIQA